MLEVADKKAVLRFEGAGWQGCIKGDIDNPRIRTRFINNTGRIIYLELTGRESGKYDKEKNRLFGFVSHCYYCDVPEEARNNRSQEIAHIEKIRYEYRKEDILDIVNKQLNCSFDSIEVDNDLFVHLSDKTIFSKSKEAV